MIYAVGSISGGHFNPAVSFGLWAGSRLPGKDLIPYVIVQVLGAIAATAILYLIATGKAGYELKSCSLVSNGYGEHSPGGYPYMLALFEGGIALTQLWFFWVMPIIGGVLGGLAWKWFENGKKTEE